MKAISLWKPWCYWVAMGWKPIETRLHNRFISLAGQRIAIHASSKWDESALKQADQYLDLWRLQQTENFQHKGSFLVCTVFVKEHRELTLEDSHLALVDCSVKRYGLILTDIEILNPVVYCRGRQGIFNV